jgi:hypothetical protein
MPGRRASYFAYFAEDGKDLALASRVSL